MPKGRRQKAKHWKNFADKRKFAFFARTKEARDLSTQEKPDDDQDKLRTVDDRDP
jgi:hypothetical protein